MMKIRFRLSLRRCHISLCMFCNNLFPSGSFCFHAKPRSYGDPHYPHYGVFLIILWQLFFLDLLRQLFLNNIRFNFLFNLDYYHNKKSKTIFNEKLSACYTVKWKCIVFNETYAFGMRYRQILWNYMANLHKKI